MAAVKETCKCCNGIGSVHYLEKEWRWYDEYDFKEKFGQCINCKGKGYVWRHAKFVQEEGQEWKA